jgi:hypothetical protein
MLRIPNGSSHSTGAQADDRHFGEHDNLDRRLRDPDDISGTATRPDAETLVTGAEGE